MAQTPNPAMPHFAPDPMSPLVQLIRFFQQPLRAVFLEPYLTFNQNQRENKKDPTKWFGGVNTKNRHPMSENTLATHICSQVSPGK